MSGYVPRKLRDRGDDRGRSSSTRRSGGRTGTATITRPPRKKSAPTRVAPEPKRRPSPRPIARAKRRADPRRVLVRLVVASITATLLAAGVYVGGLVWGPGDHGEAAAKGARSAASALFSYDYRDFDASLANGASHAHGAFATSWTEAMEALRETVVDQEAQVVAKVVDVAVVNPSTTFTAKDGTVHDGAVEVLAFMDQTTKNAEIEGVKRDQSRVVLTMVEVDGRWLAVDALAL